MHRKVYFLSDLHLGARYITDPRAHERRIVSWLRSIAPDARAIYLLGDILDFWWEYRTVVPRGYVRFFGELARLADDGVAITWLIGNHDIWINDYIPSELGVTVIDGSLTVDIDNRRFFLAHGDAVGHIPPGFRFIRALFRNKIARMLFGSIHPRWAVPFAHACSSSSRMADKSATADVDTVIAPLVDFARSQAAADPSLDFFIFGHLHTPVDRCLDVRQARVIILGDWITNPGYAVWDGHSLTLKNI